MKISAFVLIFLSLLFLVPAFFLFEISPPNKKVEMAFEVKRGESLMEVAGNLERKGLVRDRLVFSLWTILKGDEGRIKAGRYLLRSSMGSPKIEKKLALGEIMKIRVTIPDGFTLNQVCQRLEKNLQNLQRSDLCKFCLADFKREFSLLRAGPDSAPLEGFLFPDTYYFSGEETGREVIDKFLKNFSKKLGPDLRREVRHQKKSVFEVITMASLIEKEVRTYKDRRLVSGILWKRLKYKMPLQVDAAPVTYKRLGLPAGPICNPGIDSIKAALYPEGSSYWYYLSAPDGKTIFSKTLRGHNIKKAKYLK